jgi:hypothetical protein
VGIEIVRSAALDAVALFDTIRYSNDPGFLPDHLWRSLVAARDDAEVRALPADTTPSAVIAALLARLAGPGRVQSLAVADVASVLSLARPIAALAPRYESSGQRFSDTVAQAAVDVLAHEQAVSRLLDVIESSGYDEFFRDVAQPVLDAEITSLTRGIEQYDVDHVLFLVAKLRSGTVPEPIYVYLSFCARDVSFHLSESEIVTSMEDGGDARRLLRLVAHELLHGFAGGALISTYTRALSTDPYLRALMTDNPWRDRIDAEEMFVTAADLYIVYKAGLYTLEEAFTILDGLKGNSLPLSVIILDQLLRSDGLPGNYNEWLLERFRRGAIRVGKIADQVDEILPGYSDSARKSLSSRAEYRAKLEAMGLR